VSLGDILDQEVAIRLLSGVARGRRVPNAMLFWGPGGVGKRLAAMELIKALNCRQGGGEACEGCLSCRKIRSGNHPDVKTVGPGGKSRQIVLDQVDEVIEYSSLRPFESSWRAVVFQDADRMNLAAQNHFLKTLEEPPGNSLFLLLSEYPRMLLPTIRSRCQMVRFRRLRPETVVAFLKRERDVADDTAEAIAHLSEGQMSRAMDLVDSPKRSVAIDFVRRLSSGEDPSELAEEFAGVLGDQRKRFEAEVESELAFEHVDEASRADIEAMKELRLGHLNALVKRDILEYLYLFQTWYRDELVYQATGDAWRVLNRDQLDCLQRPSSDPEEKIKAVERAFKQLDRFINEERVFRVLFFSLAAK